MATPEVIVIGAGVIGLSVALAAQARGLRVAVIDREGPAAGASAGNAGAFAFTDILPLASPGIMRQAPMWLMDPLGPLSVPPAYALRIAPWMYRFWRACSPRAVAASTAAQTAMMDLSDGLVLDAGRLAAASGLRAVIDLAGSHGFSTPEIVEMPANNLSLVFKRL